MAFSIGTAIKIGSSALGMLSKKKANAPMTPLQLAARSLATQPYQTSSIGTPGRPETGGTRRPRESAETYDYYRMVATAKLVANRLDPEAGTRVGEYGAIKESSIKNKT